MGWVAAVDFRRGGDSCAAQPRRNFGKLERLHNGVVIGAVANVALSNLSKAASRARRAVKRLDGEVKRGPAWRVPCINGRAQFAERIDRVDLTVE